MAKRRPDSVNPPKPQQRRFTATPMVMAYINDLVKTGLYGSKRSEVAGRLVAMSIERLIRNATIARRTKPPGQQDLGNEEDE
jgi:hypothetical protein